MYNNSKKNKMSNANIEEYMAQLSAKCEQKIPIYCKLVKVNEDDFIIPTLKTYHDMTKYNYNLSQLKNIAKNYKLKIGGNKTEIINRIYVYLDLSCYVIKIQKLFRGTLRRKYNKLHGPAYIKRILCTNSTDFISLEPIEEIEGNQFLSYKDTDGFIYGFDIVSLHNLILKNGKEVKNPYNRNVIPDFVIKNVRDIIHFTRILNIHINLHIQDDSLNVSSEKAIELRCLTLFQNIDALGNYSNPEWFLSLNRNQIIKFIREICDIWNYRAQLSMEIKRNICPPNGDPFRNLNMQFIHTELNLYNVKKVVLEVLEKLVNNGVDKDSKALGAYYVLGALTLVNENAAISLPWLFQSVSYI